MGAELTREERDAFERLQVEVVELRRLLGELPPEVAREEAAAKKAEALRDELLAAVKARDEALREPRDRLRN